MPGVTWPHNQAAEAEAAQHMTNAPLGQHNAEPLSNGARQISSAPAHYGVLCQIRAAAHPLRHLRLLLGRQTPLRPGFAQPSSQPCQALSVVAMHPIAQRLPP